MKRKRILLWVFFSLMLLFAIATSIGGVLVLTHYYNSLFAVIPATLAGVCLLLCRKYRKDLIKEERDRE